MRPHSLEQEVCGKRTSAEEINPGEESVGSFPLSFAQEGVWFFEQVAPGTSSYNMPEAWRLNGRLDVRALEASIEKVIHRHEILRTVFAATAGTAAQLVRPPTPFRLVVRDLSECAGKETELQRLLSEEARRPFDLAQGPLLRIGLIRLAAQEHVLVLNMHHIISDAWSVGVLLRELAQYYRATLEHKSEEPRELPIQYADFASWQREQFQGESQKQPVEYWAAQLNPALPILAIPTDHPRPARQSFRGATRFFALAKPLCRGIEDLSRKTGSTLFMTLLAAFNVLLRRYSRQDDIVIGSPISGRDRPETEGLIGMFVNTLTLRTDLSGDPTFLELLKRVRETTLGAYEQREMPIEKLVEELRLERRAGHHPLFQVVLGLQQDFAEDWTLPELTGTRIELDSGTAKFDWTLLFTETKEGLRLRFEYSTELFDAGTVDRFVHQFELLLAGIIASPEKRLSEFDLLSPQEKQALLRDQNPTATPVERDHRVHEIFGARAKAEPSAIALIFDGQEMTYAELNRRANQLARRLQGAGVGSGMPVGICLDRSPEMIIAMLAILKAGGAYVPLDRTYPKERIEFMLSDSRAKVAVTHSSAWRKDLTWEQGTIIYLDKDKDEIARESDENLSSTGTAESLAYLIYTSGSTGVPKGTEITHRGVVRLVRNTNYAEFSSKEVFLQLAPITFDASTFEIWGALLNGAKLVIFPPHPPTYEELGRTIREAKVTTLWLTAGLFHQMVDYQIAGLKGLRQLLAGGEALSAPHVAKALRELPGCHIINGYGPTENTTFTCCYRVPAGWTGGTSVPIGKPVSNTQVYIVDEHGQPTPVGVPGELWIGGDGLARGYLNQPELTAKCFVANPFGKEPNDSVLYRTGDLCRWLPDGNIEFLGRIDDQLKIRGFRVEPGEIEKVLAGHPAVAQVVVAAQNDNSGAKQLVAYAVLKESKAIEDSALTEFLRTKLPAYMVPSRVVQLPELPLTRNGKIDRGALLPPECFEDERIAVVDPRTLTESLLSEIWRELLGRKAVSISDNFFHLGGHSLLATQMISRIARTFGVELPVTTVFEAPTIEGIAGLIDKAKHEGSEQLTSIRRRVRWESSKAVLEQLDKLSDTEVEELLAQTELKRALA
jgi:aspartate racemase